VGKPELGIGIGLGIGLFIPFSSISSPFILISITPPFYNSLLLCLYVTFICRFGWVA
jgi:hypothetical protein